MGLMPQQRNLLKSNTIKLFPKINFILGNNVVEPRGIKSNYFGEDLERIANIHLIIFLKIILRVIDLIHKPCPKASCHYNPHPYPVR